MDIHLPSKTKMCSKKKSFRSKIAAEKIAIRFDQRIYECPICFCWHTTSKQDWTEEFIDRDTVRYMLETLVTQFDNRKLKQENNLKNLEGQISNLKRKCEFYKSELQKLKDTQEN